MFPNSSFRFRFTKEVKYAFISRMVPGICRSNLTKQMRFTKKDEALMKRPVSLSVLRFPSRQSNFGTEDWTDKQRITNHKSASRKEIRMDIKVLGPGCPKCEQTEKLVREAVDETGADAQIEKITDVMKIAGYGVFVTPAVVIDGEVKSVGKIPAKEDIKKWLGK